MSQPKVTSRKIIFIFIFLEVLILASSWFTSENTLDAWQTIARYSGRLSLFVFSAILLLYSHPTLSTRWLSEKPYLAFAIVHGIHLIELLIYVRLSGTQLIPYRVLGGFAAYALIFLLPWLQDRCLSGKMSSTMFRRTENFYLYYVWFIFFMAYLPRIQGKLPNAGGTFAEHLTLFVWVLIVLILHLIMRFRRPVVRNTHA